MKRITLLAPALAALFLLAGCANYAPSAPDNGGGEPGVVGEVPGGDGSVTDDDRSVIITGEVVITADDPIAASDEAERLVKAAGGRIDGRSESGPSEYGPGSAALELRIPADRLDEVLEDLRSVGRVDSVRTESADVTIQTRDLEARISALEASIERLRALMAEATDVGDLILVESELSSRQAELEGLQAQKRVLDEQVAMSTIWLSLRAPSDAASPLPDDFGEGVLFGWEGFLAFWAGVLVALGVLVPWIVLAAIVVVVIVLLVKRRRRKRAGLAAVPAGAPASMSDAAAENEVPAEPR